MSYQKIQKLEIYLRNQNRYRGTSIVEDVDSSLQKQEVVYPTTPAFIKAFRFSFSFHFWYVLRIMS